MFGVFVHRPDSIYNDRVTEQYQFPASYLSRATPCIGDWIVYYEPTKVPNSRGYFAMARVAAIDPDPTVVGMYVARIMPGSYLPFANTVPFRDAGGYIERGLLNDRAVLSGRAQSAVRALSAADLDRILDLAFAGDADILPRVDDPLRPSFRDERAAYMFEQPRERIERITARPERDRLFRRMVLRAHEERCAVTGLRLINGGGRAEVQAAHIRPVIADGPDIVANGLALSGTAHWMFDRGLIALSDNLDILISRQANDRASIEAMIHRSGKAVVPLDVADRPHPRYLRWHRDNCFKT